MDIAKATFLGNSSLGIFALATDKYILLPYSIKQNILETVEKVLEVPIIQTTVGGTVLVGAMVAGNSNILFVPSTISPEEMNLIKSPLEGKVEIIEIESKLTALGNLIVMNDKGAIISETFEKQVQKKFEDTIGTEVVFGNLMESPLVGTLTFSTNRGALVHPLLSEEESRAISSILRVKTDLCTVNRGVPYPRVGIIANSKGAVIGSDTTGPESMRIFEVLLSP